MESYENILNRLNTKFEEFAGFSADDATDIGIRLKVLAGELFSLYSELNYIKNQMFVQTAFGKGLDNHAAQRGLKRKDAVKSNGTLTFSRDNALPYSISIPAYTVCCTGSVDDGIRFETIEEATLAAGSTSVNVKAESLEGGQGKNVAAGTVTVMVSPPSGITYVTNNSRFSGGVDEETDDELRKRIEESYTKISNGTNTAFYKSVALSHNGVYSASVVPVARGTGTVDVYVAGKGEHVSEDVLSEVENDLSERREINVDVKVKSPELISIATIIYITVKENYVFNEVKNNCITAIENYYSSLGIGDSFYVSALVDRVYHVDGVKNYYISPTSMYDRTLSNSQLAIAGSINVYEQQ